MKHSTITIIIILFLSFIYTINCFGQIKPIPYYDGQKWGFIDKDSNIVIECKYDTAGEFKWDNYSHDLAVVNNNGVWEHIDKRGRLWSRSFDGYINGKVGYISEGKMIIPFEYDSILRGARLLIAFKNDSASIHNYDKEILYDYVEEVDINKSMSRIFFKHNNLYHFIFRNEKGAKTSSFKADYISNLYYSSCITNTDNKYGLYGHYGKWILEQEYDTILIDGKYNKYAYKNSGELKILDEDGKFKTYKIDSLKFFKSRNNDKNYRDWTNGPIALYKKFDGKYFLVDLEGNKLTENSFENIINEGYQSLVVKTKNKQGVIDFNGNWIVEPRYDQIDYNNAPMYVIDSAGLKGLKFHSTYRSYYINDYGFSCKYQDIKLTKYDRFSFGFWLLKDSTWNFNGFKDSIIQVDSVIDNITPIQTTKIGMYKGKRILFNQLGKNILLDEYDTISLKQPLIFDINGQSNISTNHEPTSRFKTKHFSVGKHKNGLFTLTDGIVISPKYDSIKTCLNYAGISDTYKDTTYLAFSGKNIFWYNSDFEFVVKDTLKEIPLILENSYVTTLLKDGKLKSYAWRNDRFKQISNKVLNPSLKDTSKKKEQIRITLSQSHNLFASDNDLTNVYFDKKRDSTDRPIIVDNPPHIRDSSSGIINSIGKIDLGILLSRTPFALYGKSLINELENTYMINASLGINLNLPEKAFLIMAKDIIDSTKTISIDSTFFTEQLTDFNTIFSNLSLKYDSINSSFRGSDSIIIEKINNNKINRKVACAIEFASSNKEELLHIQLSTGKLCYYFHYSSNENILNIYSNSEKFTKLINDIYWKKVFDKKPENVKFCVKIDLNNPMINFMRRKWENY